MQNQLLNPSLLWRKEAEVWCGEYRLDSFLGDLSIDRRCKYIFYSSSYLADGDKFWDCLGLTSIRLIGKSFLFVMSSPILFRKSSFSSRMYVFPCYPSSSSIGLTSCCSVAVIPLVTSNDFVENAFCLPLGRGILLSWWILCEKSSLPIVSKSFVGKLLRYWLAFCCASSNIFWTLALLNL